MPETKYNKVKIDGVWCVPVPENLLLEMIRKINEKNSQTSGN